MSDYKPLSVQYLSGAVRVSQPASPQPVTLESPACEVMTDLRHVSAAVISPDTPMEIANTYMMQRGIRSLFVMNQDNTLSGIITATDILGEKPLRFIQERRIRHSDILVRDMMTPLDKLDAIPIGEIEHAKVGNIVASLRESGRLHTLVIENQIDSLPKICGIFSWTQIEKQLGAVIMPNNVAKSFAEIETTLIGG